LSLFFSTPHVYLSIAVSYLTRRIPAEGRLGGTKQRHERKAGENGRKREREIGNSCTSQQRETEGEGERDSGEKRERENREKDGGKNGANWTRKSNGS
jgi:hypothetical protein